MHRYLPALAVLLVLLVTTGGCDDFLVETPKTQTAVDQFFDSPEDAVSTVNAIYRSGAPSFYHGGGLRGNGGMLGGYMSGLFDNQDKGEALSIFHTQNLTLDGSNLSLFLGDLWARCYQAISRANSAVKYVPVTEGLSEADANRLLAEARFFRAFNYFYLVKHFGPVPLVTEPVESLDDVLVARDGLATVYDQIVADLTWAIENGGLSTAPFPMNGFRVTEGAAATLLADVQLQMAGHPLQAQGAYAGAAATARRVIQAGQHALIEHGPTVEESAYNVMRTSDVEREYVYAVEYNADHNPSGAPTFAYPGNVRPPGIKYSRTLNGYFPIDEYVRVYDPEKDLRIQNRQFFFDSIVLDGTLYEFDLTTYLFHDDRALFETGRGDMDMRVYRYAEVLLIAAEAIARSEGVTPEAVGYLADVRSRAYWQTPRDEIVAALSGLSVDAFVEEVWKERLRELPLDFKTWSDIQRTRLYPTTTEAAPGAVTFVPVVGQSNNWGKTFQEHHLLFPIPDDELRRNPELEQNPGY